jgi:hypothetical protein
MLMLISLVVCDLQTCMPLEGQFCYAMVMATVPNEDLLWDVCLFFEAPDGTMCGSFHHPCLLWLTCHTGS